MALRNISLEEMIAVSGAWLAKAGHRAAFEAVPAWAALLPALGAAHADLLRAETPGVDAASAKEIARLTQECLAEDAAHDRNGRGGWLVLEGLIELVGADSERGQALAALQARAFPAGVGIVGKSYAAEAGNAEKVLAALEADKHLRAELKALELPIERTLFDVVKAHATAGVKLGKADQKRGQLQAAGAGAGAATPPPSLAVARNAWMQVVADVVRMARHAPAAHQAAVADALVVLHRAEAHGDQRAGHRGAPSAGDPSAAGGDAGAKGSGPA
jgi:hypothetical protein